MAISEPTAIFSIRDEKDEEIKKVVLQVYSALEEKGYTFETAEVQQVPNTYVSLTDEDSMKKMSLLLEKLEDNDDVQNVWHNWENEGDYEG